MKILLRFFQLLAVTTWVGGLIFFAFVLAPTAFHVLPSVHEAGLVVGATLKLFDKVALVSAVIFLLTTSALPERQTAPRVSRRILLVTVSVMMLGTLYLQWNIIPAMDADQQLAGGDINALRPSEQARIDFDKLHRQSEQVAGGILLLGLGTIWLLSRDLSSPQGKEPPC